VKEINNSELLDAINKLVQAELKKAEELSKQNELVERSLEEIRRTRIAEQQRRRLAFDTQDMVTGLITALREVFTDIAFIRKMIEEFDRRSERTDDILLLLLTEHSQQLVTEMTDDLQGDISLRRSSQEELLHTHYNNLMKLKQQAAFQGQQVALDLMNQIEAEERAIKILEKQLGEDQNAEETREEPSSR